MSTERDDYRHPFIDPTRPSYQRRNARAIDAFQTETDKLQNRPAPGAQTVAGSGVISATTPSSLASSLYSRPGLAAQMQPVLRPAAAADTARRQASANPAAAPAAPLQGPMQSGSTLDAYTPPTSSPRFQSTGRGVVNNSPGVQNLLDEAMSPEAKAAKAQGMTPYGMATVRQAGPGENNPDGTPKIALSGDQSTGPQRNAPTQQQQVMFKHPAIGIKGSPENIAFTEAHNAATRRGETPDMHALAEEIMGTIAKQNAAGPMSETEADADLANRTPPDTKPGSQPDAGNGDQPEPDLRNDQLISDFKTMADDNRQKVSDAMKPPGTGTPQIYANNPPPGNPGDPAPQHVDPPVPPAPPVYVNNPAPNDPNPPQHVDPPTPAPPKLAPFVVGQPPFAWSPEATQPPSTVSTEQPKLDPYSLPTTDNPAAAGIVDGKPTRAAKPPAAPAKRPKFRG